MRNRWRLRPHLARALTCGLLALALPFCLLAEAPTATVGALDTCQPRAVAADLCAKVTHPTDMAAVLAEAPFSVDGGGLPAHPLCTEETFTCPLPGYLTTPSGRSPPLL